MNILPDSANLIKRSELQKARISHGIDAVKFIMEKPNQYIIMNKQDIRGRLFASQDFFDSQKFQRAKLITREVFVAPCSYQIDEMGFVRFALLDGHHRTLLNYHHNIGIILQPLDAKFNPILSFRNFYRLHATQIMSE